MSSVIVPRYRSYVRRQGMIPEAAIYCSPNSWTTLFTYIVCYKLHCVTCVLVFEFTKGKGYRAGLIGTNFSWYDKRQTRLQMSSFTNNWSVFSASQICRTTRKGLRVYFPSCLHCPYSVPGLPPPFFAYGKRLNMARPGRKAVTVQGSQKTGSLAHVTYLVYYMYVKTQFLTRQRNC